MTLAGSRWAEEMHGLVSIDEAKLRQGEDAIAVKRRLEGEVETNECLDRRKPTHSQRRLDAAVLAQGQLLGKKDIDRFKGRQLAVFEASHNMVERLQCARHLQADQVMANTVDHGWYGIECCTH